jgi:N6-adenosine-specific RNA methylase IME4
MALPIDKMIKEKGFIFVWSGSEHLDDTRLLFKKWGLK